MPRAVSASVEETLAGLPAAPGVYLMRGARGEVVYIGKARSLRSRVRSYFRRGDRTPKTISLVQRVVDLEVIVTDSEVEALLLENNLIKEHRPPFNVTFRDDKGYLYVKITVGETYPRVGTTRRILKDGALYFGPFTSAKSVRQTLKLLNRLFPYRTCTIDMGTPIPRPCLKYHLGLCIAPCTRACTVEEYAAVVDGATGFMRGDYDHVVEQLTDQMWSAAEAHDFEAAAKHRDRLRAIDKVVAEQKITDLRGGQIDVIAVAREGRVAQATVLRIRGGKMIGRGAYELAVTGEETDGEMLDDFVREYYDRAPEVPLLVLTSAELSDPEPLAAWLSAMRGAKVEVRAPQRGQKRKLVAMAARNVRETLQIERTRWLNSGRKLRQALLEIGTALGLERLPRRIEAYDISHIQGALVVGSLVVFEDGVAKKGKYRRFKVRNVPGNDDFESMREVLRRRFTRFTKIAGEASGASSGERALAVVPLQEMNADAELPAPINVTAGSSNEWGSVPDLVLIDGGKGQLSAALDVFREFGLDPAEIPLAAIAKQREELFVPGRSGPILLPHDSDGMRLLQRIRDEAHRFAVSFHIKLRTKKGRRSILDEIPGIGPKRKRALIRAFGSLERIRQASATELATVDGMTASAARALKEAL